MDQPGRSGSHLSILTPVFDPAEAVLASCIESVLGQTSHRWEWCIVDDGSTRPHVGRQLDALAATEPRVRLARSPANGGIVDATNRALAMATGSRVAFLDHDDELADVAVEAVLAAFDEDPSIAIAYSDEYLIDESGTVIAPYDKPDFSPERLRAHNYFNHLVVADRAYAVASGGLRTGFEGAQDYDFNLRAVEHFGGARHIPARLYRWRAVASSVALDPEAKPAALSSVERAIREHLSRTGVDATTSPAPGAHFSFRLHRTLRGRPKVTFVICAVGEEVPSLVGDALRQGGYSNIELVVADVAQPRPEAINAAVERAHGEVVVIVEGDLALRRGDLLGELVPLVQHDDVAAAGPTLVLPDGRRAANGITFAGGPSPFGARSATGDSGPWGMYRVTREVSAVSTACMAARREVFLAVGGMAPCLPPELRGADYGMRAGRAGHRVLVSPFAEVEVPWAFDRPLTDGARQTWVERWGDDADRERYSPFDRIEDERASAARWAHLTALTGV